MSVMICSIFLAVILNTLGMIVAPPISSALRSSGWFDIDNYAVMSRYCEDLTEKARGGEYHDYFTSEDKMDQFIIALELDKKKNVCLVGKQGVGKCALVEGLAYRIANGKVDEKMKNKKIIRINISQLITGCSNNLQTNALSRLRSIFDKAERNKDMILFIDETSKMFQIEGAPSLFKAYLERGNIQVVATETDDQYANNSHNDIENNFTHIFLKEPNKFETFQILKSLRENINKKYGVNVNDAALMNLVEMTGKYMKNRLYPDKAVDMLNISAVNAQSRVGQNAGYITIDDIKESISKSTNIPITDISYSETTALSTLNKRIKQIIIGQDEAVDSVCHAIKGGRIGVCDPEKPIASFLFLGMAGSGKSELAKVVGEEVGNLIYLDMLYYSSKNSLDNLIGSKRENYKSELIEKIVKQPRSVVVFDNIEKADQNIINVISGIIDKGYLIVRDGSKIDFTNSIIIMISNMGNEIFKQCSKDISEKDLKAQIRSYAEKNFDSNIIRKVDNIITFNPISSEGYKHIADIMISKLESRFYAQNIYLDVSDSAKKYIYETEVDPCYGARKIESVLREKIQQPLAALLIDGQVNSGDQVTCELQEGKFLFKVL